MSEPRVYRAEEWPHGLSCPACGRVAEEGDPFLERLDGVAVDCEFVTVGFCPGCLPAAPERGYPATP